MKKSFLFLTALFMGASLCAFAKKPVEKQAEPKQPKYVFYFISDGTGVNTLQLAEYYLGQTKGIAGRVPLFMSANYPVVGVSATWSTSNDITDSAASGTALAGGEKTYNTAIGVKTDSVTPIYSVAKRAHDAGYVVGVGSSVPVNHATPAAHYAHNRTRHNYFDIACQLPNEGFEFFGGSCINIETKMKTPENIAHVEKVCKDAGYTITRGLSDYLANGRNADKVIMLQGEVPDPYSLPYWIDRKEGQVTIVDQLRAEIEFLYAKSQKNGCKGFYLMNEIGGKVDFSCHANDGATAIQEVLAVDSCMHVAFDFYRQHPDETLIVLTADHETGGLTLGVNYSGDIHTDVLQYQKVSKDEATRHIEALRTMPQDTIQWEQVKELLTRDFGFWKEVKMTQKDEERLYDVYRRSFLGSMENEKNLYGENAPLAALAVRILNEKARLGWSTGGHTAGLVPCIACGVGQELFMGHNDNAEIARKLAQLLGL